MIEEFNHKKSSLTPHKDLLDFGFKDPLHPKARSVYINNVWRLDKMAKEERKPMENSENFPRHGGNRQPLKKFRVGGVTATIWENEAIKDKQTFVNYSIDISRSYLDKKEEWQKTSSFNLRDLPKVELAAKKAFEFLMIKEDKEEE